MDSMRSLNSSLPRSSPHKKTSSHLPLQTVQAFKTAALEVANLYRAAASDQQLARQSGYQDALDDLLTFLDRENIGLDDGEGWQVRQWATERHESNPAAHGANDSDDEQAEPESNVKDTTTNSQQHNLEDQEHTKHTPASSTAHTEPPALSTSTSANIHVPSSEEFTFRSAAPVAADVDMHGNDTSLRTQTAPALRSQQKPNIQPTSVRLEVLPRPATSTHKSLVGVRSSPRTTGANKINTPHAGSKRKINIADLFDLGDLDEFRELQGGGAKRGRTT